MHPSPFQPNTSHGTPRTRKPPGGKRTDSVLTELPFAPSYIKSTVKRKLGLSFDIADWQAHQIKRILLGYDSLCIAGTGYGKGVLFEGLAAMSPRHTVLVVCALKTLEIDQVCRGLDCSPN